MTPYCWRLSDYLCPECDSRLESKGGPDHVGVQRCPSCDWWKVYDQGVGEFPSDELDSVTPVTDGGNSTDSIDRAPCMAGCGRERPVDQLVVRRDHAAQAPRPVVRVCPGCAEEPRYVAVDSDGEKNVSQDTLYPSEVVLS